MAVVLQRLDRDQLHVAGPGHRCLFVVSLTSGYLVTPLYGAPAFGDAGSAFPFASGDPYLNTLVPDG